MKVLQILLFCFLSLSAFAATETYSIREHAGSFSITNGFDIEIEDGKFQDLGSGLFVDLSQKLQLKLGLTDNVGSNVIANYASISVDVTVTPYIGAVAQTPLQTQTLTLSYHGDGNVSFADIKSSSLINTGFHKYSINVVPTATNYPSTIYIEAILTIERFYHLNTDLTGYLLGANGIVYDNAEPTGEQLPVPLATGAIVPPSIHELEIFWGFIEGAEEYELEWAWIDNYDNSLLNDFIPASDPAMVWTERDFELNNTRIITNQQTYRIPLIYGKGYLIYRVRGIGRWTNNGTADIDKHKFSDWSTDISAPMVSVSSWPHYVQIDTEHENKLNWQFQSVYAEDGKKKEIVSYFDGTLRNRQTVTKVNSNNEAIVGENIYDNQGRAAINILPTPVNFPAIEYYPGLNKNNINNSFSHNDFDWDYLGENICQPNLNSMSTASGASKYYSTNNTIENNWQDYVPTAGGYPFTQTVFTPDNTGRIKAQSGVGADYTIGSSHATQYFYSHAEQEDLDKLFGYQIGYAKHYKKNMVVDANGQVSISYLDPQGRVIATSLAGNNNTNLLSLDSEIASATTINIDALNKSSLSPFDTDLDNNHQSSSGDINSQNDILLLNQNIDNQVTGDVFTFDYDIETKFFNDECLNDGTEIPLSYDLEIRLMNDCGEDLLDEVNREVVVGNENSYSSITLIKDDIDDMMAVREYDFNSIPLPIGVYSLSKELKVDPIKFQEHLTTYLENNSCLLQPGTDFYFDNVNCDDVLPDPSTGLYDPASGTTCFTSEALMLMDLSPNGQYGATDEIDPLSVFTMGNALNHGVVTPGEDWKNPFTPYLNIDGTPALVEATLQQNGDYLPLVDNPPPGPNQPAVINVPPEEITNLSDFVAVWDNEWAKSLLPYHPEYDYFDFMNLICDEVSTSSPALSSMYYDIELQNITTFADAILYVNGMLTNATAIKNSDPFFNISYSALVTNGNNGNALKNDIINVILNNYKNEGSSLLDYCKKMVFCGNNLSGGCTIPTWTAINSSSYTDAQRDQFWQTFRSLYLAEKKKLIQVFLDVYTITNGTFNGYIGANTPATPGLSNYTYYTTGGTPNVMLTLMSLYADAITTSNNNSSSSIFQVFPWFFGSSTVSFQDKTRRFTPIDDLYDSSIPEIDMALEMAADVEAQIFAKTGRCKLSFDLELLLGEMVNKDLLVTSSPQSSDLLYTLSESFYEAMGGTVTQGLPIEFSGVQQGSNLLISVSGATHNITLSGIGSYNWSDIISFSDFYVEPGTFYNFEILAIVEISPGNIVEVVINGQTGIQIGDCSVGQACDKGDILADNMGAIYATLFGSSLLTTSTNNYPLSNLASSWFDGSELQFQLNAFGANSLQLTTVDVMGPQQFKISYLGTSIIWTFTTAPVNAQVFMGYSYVNGGQINVYYLDNLGIQQTAEAQITLSSAGSMPMPIEIDCDCPAADEVMELYKTFLIDIFTEYNFNGGNLSPNYFPNSLLAIQPYFDDPGLVDGVEFFSVGDPNDVAHNAVDIIIAGCNMLSFSFTGLNGATGYVLSPSGQYLPNNLPGSNTYTVIDLVYDFVSSSGVITDLALILEDEEGNIYYLLAESMPCINIGNCTPCPPTTFGLVSCNDAFLTYSNYVGNATYPGLNDGLLEVDQFKVYTLEEFCQTNLAYVVDAYMAYNMQFGITDNNHAYYLTLAEFGTTQMHAATTVDIVNQYHTFIDGAPVPNVTWHEFVNELYMVDEAICPPNPRFKPPTIQITEPPCEQLTLYSDIVNASNQYEIYLQNVIDDFTERYLAQAMSTVVEELKYTKSQSEYHYTLYYYDQAGNLIQTVPPKEAQDIAATMSKISIEARRSTNVLPTSFPNTIVPDLGGLETNYEYNSLNQLVWQQTPDGGISEFAYDALGRLVVSQNAKQKANNDVSYTVYDGLGRIVEVGELTLNNANYTFSNGKLLENGNPVQLSDIPGQTPVSFPANIEDLSSGSTRREVTITLYDELLISNALNKFHDYSPFNTRNRITGVLYFDEYAGSGTSGYDNGTFYDYDVHGNVKELIQDIQDADLIAIDPTQAQKSTQYDYDLVSGNVKEVAYQKGEEDQFVHRYCYDADNRITIAETSKDYLNWEKDAKYFYYDHGPLARVEIGEEKVQSCDYAYTIQGWLKGVNSEDLQTSTDQGRDGQNANMNQMNGKDVVGYSLKYFDGDYSGRFNNDFLAFSNASSAANNPDLFNGNIKEMYTASTKTNQTYLGTSHTWYRYDQLNRIRSMNQEDLAVNDMSSFTGGNYSSTYEYDENGNLESLNRVSANLSNTSQPIDQLAYEYIPGTNKLRYVSDPLGNVLGTDLADQSNYSGSSTFIYGADNYDYDAIGQLIQDKQSEIKDIEWMVTGKVKKIDKTGSLNDISFEYDAMGNRVKKIIRDASGVLISKKFYIRGAQGNVMSIYDLKINDAVITNTAEFYADAYRLAERNIYGSSRIGIEAVDQVMACSNISGININEENDVVNGIYVQLQGDKRYELSNHLGNVLEVISDRKLAIETAPNSGILAYYSPDVISQSDYYPFGMMLPNRNQSQDDYRYGFQGQEMDDEVKGEGNSVNFKFRMHDPRVGRFFTIDPLTAKYPFYTPYSFSGNKVIKFTELEGLEEEETGTIVTTTPLNLFAEIVFGGDNIVTIAPPTNPLMSSEQVSFGDGFQDGAASNFSMIEIRLLYGWMPTPNTLIELSPMSFLSPDAAINAIQASIEMSEMPADYAMGFAAEKIVELIILRRIAKTSSMSKKPSTRTSKAQIESKTSSTQGNANLKPGEQTATPKSNSAVVENGPKPKPTKAPLHHIATNKNSKSTARGGPWTPRFTKFFEGAGLDINKANENLVRVVGHKGPHPKAYHQYVFDKLTTATKGLKPGTTAYRGAVVETLNSIGKEAITVGSPLNKMLTKTD